MKIAKAGSDYLGLVSGTGFHHFGYDVVRIDKDPSQIQRRRYRLKRFIPTED